MEEKARGLSAKDRLIDLLEIAAGGKFTLESHGLGKYGRSLGTIWVGQVNINKTLLDEGHATEYTG